jgi:hypothetical protein
MRKALERVRHYFLERYGHQNPLARMDDATASVYKQVCAALNEDAAEFRAVDFYGRPIEPKAL